MNYIKKTLEGTCIAEKGKEVILNKGIASYINDLCTKQLFTYVGRINSTKKILGLKSLIPIYINKKVCLVPTYSVRTDMCIWINYMEIKAIYSDTTIVFQDGHSLKIDRNIQFILKQIRKAAEIEKYINNSLE